MLAQLGTRANTALVTGSATPSPGAGMSAPELVDIVDLGLTQHFLANDASSAAALLANPRCLSALSCDAQVRAPHDALDGTG